MAGSETYTKPQDVNQQDAQSYLESAHKVVKKVKTPSPSQPTRKLGSSCTNLTI